MNGQAHCRTYFLSLGSCDILKILHIYLFMLNNLNLSSLETHTYCMLPMISLLHYSKIGLSFLSQLNVVYWRGLSVCSRWEKLQAMHILCVCVFFLFLLVQAVKQLTHASYCMNRAGACQALGINRQIDKDLLRILSFSLSHINKWLGYFYGKDNSALWAVVQTDKSYTLLCLLPKRKMF